MLFQHRFLSVLASFWRPRWLPNRSKIDQNWVFKPFCFRIDFHIDFSSIFSLNFDPLDLQKVCFSLGKTRFFEKTPFEDNIDFGFDFGANLPLCWPPKSKIFQNYGLPRGLQNFILFRIDFLLILAPSWAPTWGHLGDQDGSKSEKMASNHFRAAPQERFWIRPCFWTSFKTVLV